MKCGGGYHREGNACVPNGHPSCGDTDNDRNNCGACGNHCGDDEVCDQGRKAKCGKGKHRHDNHCDDDKGHDDHGGED